MKTLQELYGEIIADDEQKRAFVEAMEAGNVEDFLRRRDCSATEDEVREFLEAKAAEDDPVQLTDDQLEEISGGVEKLFPGEGTYGCTEKASCSCTCAIDCC